MCDIHNWLNQLNGGDEVIPKLEWCSFNSHWMGSPVFSICWNSFFVLHWILCAHWKPSFIKWDFIYCHDSYDSISIVPTYLWNPSRAISNLYIESTLLIQQSMSFVAKKSEIYKQHLFSQLKNSQSHLISSDSWDVIKTIHFCWSFAIISSFTDNSRHSDHRLILFQFVLAWNWLILTWQATAVAWKTIKFEKGIEKRSNENHCTKLL